VRFVYIISLAVLLFACAATDFHESKSNFARSKSITIALADSLWALRADSANAYYALACFKQLAEKDSSSIEIWSKLSRAYYFIGQYLTPEAQIRDSLLMAGYEASQTILNQNSKYRNLLFSTGDENIAVRGLDISCIDALYWGMANYGQWLATKGTLVRLGQRELIWTTLKHVNDLDSNYYFGAYYRYKGGLLARDPATQSDTLAIRKAFEKAIQISPDYLGNYTLMARHYCSLTGDKNLFYQLLTKVITSKSNTSMPFYAENLYERGLAERLMIKAENENWFIR